MTGTITDVILFEEVNIILFTISVTEGTQLIARVPLLRENIRMGEYDKNALIKTAIDIVKYRIASNNNRYSSQSEVADEFDGFWWDEGEIQ